MVDDIEAEMRLELADQKQAREDAVLSSLAEHSLLNGERSVEC